MAPRAPSPPPPHHPRVRDVSATSRKGSIQAPSLSQSNEADDERSENSESADEDDEDDDDLLSMGPDSGTVRDEMEQPAYEGEDARFTSRNELRGFFMYGWAAEVCSCISVQEVGEVWTRLTW
jgi:UMF1 family MFS transporter